RGRSGMRSSYRRLLTASIAPMGSGELALHPGRRILRQVGHPAEELVHVLSHDATAEVALQELVETRRHALAEQPAAPKRRNHEALHGSEPADRRQVARQLVALALHAREELGDVDSGLLPALEQRHEETLLVAVVDHGPGRVQGEVLELLARGVAQLGHAALDVLDAVCVVA